ncbi:MAG: SpoVA/SpoVAEb family sporulation membrane protein [Oscillospiraceae bacterium]|nr:SpoVA/SpoVAEb family sporulation membrane protein [Oscillospiraceae bacterium]
MQYFKVFLVGGAFCAVGQILVDKTKLTPARILTAFVVAGVVLGAFGAYGWLVDFAGAGATVPITGFGYALSEGVRRAVVERGFLGVFTGGFTAASGGTAAAIVFAVAAAMVSRSKIKS